MKDIRLMVARELNKMAKELIAKDYEYIYDPDHKKHPGGGFQKTEKGWQKGKQEKKEQKPAEISKDQQYREFRKKYPHGAGMWHKTPQYKTVTKYEIEINSNNVYGAYKALAKHFGDKKSQVALTALEVLHNTEGYLTPELGALRKKYTDPLYQQMQNDTKLQQARHIYDMEQYGNHKH